MLGSILILFGAVIVLLPNFHKPQIGDLFILIASLIAPVGNFFQKRARQKVSGVTILFMRSLISTPFLFVLAYLFKENFSLIDLNKSIYLLLANGVLLLGLSKIFWIEGIYRIGVTKSNALTSIAPLLTILFAYILLHQQPSIFQILAFIPMFIGVILLGKNNNSVLKPN